MICMLKRLLRKGLLRKGLLRKGFPFSKSVRLLERVSV